MANQKFIFNHVVLEDRKEVWIKGGYPGVLGVKAFMKQHYPDYKACLAREEFIEELKINPGARNRLDT